MVTSISRSDQIMGLIGQRKEGLTHSEINARLRLPKSSLSRILSTLVDLKYLTINPFNKKYLLGPRILALTGEYLSGLDVFEVGKGFVGDLAKLTGETVTLAIANQWEIFVIAIENVPDTILRAPRVGFHMPIYATAVGKAVMAFRPEEAVEQYLTSTELLPLTPHTITDREIIKQELDAVRREGVAYCREGFREFVVTLAAPIFNYQGEVIASLAVSMLSLHVTKEKEKEIKQILCDTAKTISQKMGLYRLSKSIDSNVEVSS